MKTLVLLALLLLPASYALAQPIGEDDGPIGGAMVGGGPIGANDGPIGGAAVGGAAVGQEDDDGAVGNQPLY